MSRLNNNIKTDLKEVGNTLGTDSPGSERVPVISCGY
jgi:hypothetical protein